MTAAVAETDRTGEVQGSEGERPRSLRARGWPYLTPVVVSLCLWTYGPLLFVGFLSVTNWNLTSSSPSFVGGQNFARLLGDPDFGAAVLRTLLYVVALLPFATIVPLGLAVLLWKRPGRASDVYRALLFLPAVLAPVAVAVSWQFVLNPLQGVANAIATGLGLSTPNWLGDPATALPAVVVITAGKTLALNVLLYSASLAGLDHKCLEAARVDGASEWQITRHIILPQLVRMTGFLALLCFVLAGQWVFTNVAVLTQGGPDGATDNIYYRLYSYGFTFFDMGRASAAALLIAGVLAVPLLAYGVLRRRGRRADG